MKRLSSTCLYLHVIFFCLAIYGYPAAHSQLKPKEQRGLGVKPSEQVTSLPGRAKRYALIVGVDQYQDTQMTSLAGASNDARSLANTLISYGGFPQDQVTVLASDQPAERQPTRGNILRRLSNLRGIVPHDGLLLFAFAGHGMERGGHAFLLPSDAQVNGDIRLLEENRYKCDSY